MDKDASIEAANIAREKTKKALKRYKVTEGVVAKRLREALDAKEVKVFNPKGNLDADGLIYSEPLIAHHIRTKAIEIAATLLEMKPSEKHEHEIKQHVVIIESNV